MQGSAINVAIIVRVNEIVSQGTQLCKEDQLIVVVTRDIRAPTVKLVQERQLNQNREPWEKPILSKVHLHGNPSCVRQM